MPLLSWQNFSYRGPDTGTVHLFEGAVFSARSRGRRHCPSLTGTLRTRRTGTPQARSPGVGPRRELPGQRTHPITQLVRLLDDERKAEADKDRQDPVETLGAPPSPPPPGRTRLAPGTARPGRPHG